jgi:thiol-disulfide isomerase/thioredoxin
MKPLEIYDNNFENNKINLKKPGLLLVRADWCGHCKRYMPTYEKLAKMFPQDGDFLIVHIESEEVKKPNASKVLENFVEYFPTMLFFDKDGNIVQKYNGDRENLPEMLKKICSMYKVCKRV